MADMGKVIPERIDSDVIDDYSTLPKGIGIYEISGPLFFASAKEYCEVLKSMGSVSKVMIIRMRHVPFVDATGVHNFKEALKILKNSGTKVVLSGVNDAVCADIRKAGIDQLIGSENIYPSFDLALEGAKKLNEEASKKRKSV